MWWLEVNPTPAEPGAGAGQSAPLLDAGDPAPGFALSAHDGGEVSSVDYYGRKPVVLFYYAKANTGG
jgi:hypothetical protein